MDVSWIPVIVCGVAYIVGLGLFIRQMLVRRMQLREVDNTYKVSVVLGGLAMIYLLLTRLL